MTIVRMILKNLKLCEVEILRRVKERFVKGVYRADEFELGWSPARGRSIKVADPYSEKPG